MAANLKRGRAKAVARQKAVAKAHGAGSAKHKAAIATTKKYNAQIKKAQGAVKRAGGSGSSGPSKPPKGFTSPTPPPIGKTSPGTGGSPTATGAANRARQGAVTGAVKRMGGDRIGKGISKRASRLGVAYKKPSKAKRLKV